MPKVIKRTYCIIKPDNGNYVVVPTSAYAKWYFDKPIAQADIPYLQTARRLCRELNGKQKPRKVKTP